MSTLSARLREAASAKTESNVVKWLKTLDAEDRAAAWKAIRDERQWKTFTLLGLFREEGAKFDKGSFVPFRRAVLAGEITEESVHGAE